MINPCFIERFESQIQIFGKKVVRIIHLNFSGKNPFETQIQIQKYQIQNRTRIFKDLSTACSSRYHNVFLGNLIRTRVGNPYDTASAFMKLKFSTFDFLNEFLAFTISTEIKQLTAFSLSQCGSGYDLQKKTSNSQFI